jgi:hypothetical protein
MQKKQSAVENLALRLPGLCNEKQQAPESQIMFKHNPYAYKGCNFSITLKEAS